MTDKTNIGALLAHLIADAQAETTEALKAKGVPAKAIKKEGGIDWSKVDTGIEHTGNKITLPAEPGKMTYADAIDTLKAKMKDESANIIVIEEIDAFPTDGAVAFVKALRMLYGWANSVPTPGFFGPKPPQMRTVDIGPNPEDKIQVPWGGFQIPGISAPVHTGADYSQTKGMCFRVYGEIRKSESHVLKEICDLARKIVAEESIYRGQALRVRSHGSSIDMENPPQFIRTADVRDDEWIMPEVVEGLIKTNIWTLIEKTAECRQAGIPLKRGVLLEGKFGTGKTITALHTAKRCVATGDRDTKNVWTYITIDRVQGLAPALEFAKRYQPCVIFAEDIDRAAEDRNEQTNDLLNTLDGVLSKSAEIMVVLTTNHVEKLNQAMLRPGRLDAVISVLPPDAGCVERLLRLYGRTLIAKGEDLVPVGKALAGEIPATIREVVERSKLGAIGRGADTVTQSDLMIAAASMKHHLNLLNRVQERVLTPEERVGAALADVVSENVTAVVAKSTAYIQQAIAEADGNGTRADHFDECQIDDMASEYSDRINPGVSAEETTATVPRIGKTKAA